jgi:hypothetical protein
MWVALAVAAASAAGALAAWLGHLKTAAESKT